MRGFRVFGVVLGTSLGSLLAVPLASPAAAGPGVVRGSFSYSYYPVIGGDEYSTCSETSDVGTCEYGSFSIDLPGKTVGPESGPCAGTIPATLAVRSGAAGLLVVPGSLAIAVGYGVFTGTLTAETRTVEVEARYAGPLCNVPTTLPIPTHVSGTFTVASTA